MEGPMKMLWRVVRVVIGFALACMAAAAIFVLFAFAPGDWASLRADLEDGERLSKAGILALKSTPHVVVSAAIPALFAAIIAERRGVVGLAFYALAGIGTAAAGFLLQYLTEAPDPESIFQAYPLIAFLTAGFVGGLVYWATSGRYAPKVGSSPG
jgi:hypothetical protein